MKYLAALFFLLMVSCSSESEKPLVLKDGLLYAEGSNKPYTGVEKAFVNNMLMEYEVVDGEKHGYFKIMDSAGNLMTSGNISHNKYEGKWEYYYPDGSIESEGYFHDHMASDEWKWYYPNGNLKETGSFFEGEREGEWKFFQEDGQLKSVVSFQEGKIVDESGIKEN